MSTINLCPHCRESSGGCNGKCIYVAPPSENVKGCICPPTSERTCQRFDCGRKPHQVTVTSGTATTRA